MTKIHPFRAIRPTRDRVHLVATRPYYTYKKNILKAKLEDNPFTFLHIINPEFGMEKNHVEKAGNHNSLVREAYKRFIDDGILIQDVSPHLYIYRQTKETHEYLGIIGGASLEEYRKDSIKKHEATLTSRENLFTDYLDVVGYNAEPVLLFYHDPAGRIEHLLGEKIQQRPEYEYITTDRIKHELWLLNSEEVLLIQDAFEEVSETYIADGHHRIASSQTLLERRITEERQRFTNENYFLAFFMNEERLSILGYHRLIQSMGDRTEMELILELSDNFEIEPLSKRAKPKETHEFTLCVAGNWYRMKCKAHLLKKEDPVSSLDSAILTDWVLKPVFGIQDLKTDKRINFFSGTEKLKKIEKKLRKQEYQVAICLFPISVEDLKRVADEHLIMPPKSTWIEPKLRSGLTIYHINE